MNQSRAGLLRQQSRMDQQSAAMDEMIANYPDEKFEELMTAAYMMCSSPVLRVASVAVLAVQRLELLRVRRELERS